MRRNILITGASSGLGYGMARQFAARGSNLALCARRVERLEELRADLEVRHPGIRVVTRRLDVNDHDDVFRAFREFRESLGSLDRVIVNAGLGKGRPVGTGYFHANRQTAETNFIAALAQCEAAAEILREQNSGHLVVISSMGAMRGMPGNMMVYSASKAGLATLAEGIRADLLDTPVKVSTIYPGYIRTEMNERVKNPRFMLDTEKGCRLLAEAIEKEPAQAFVPAWPWSPIAAALRFMPLRWVAKVT